MLFVPDLTLNDLARTGRPLQLHCRTCGHEANADPIALGLKLSTKVRRIQRAIRCQECHSYQVDALPTAVPPTVARPHDLARDRA
jgi:hypothetical protein